MTCAHCDGLLGASPSDMFCSEDCQWMWFYVRSGRADPDLVARVEELDRQITDMIRRLDAPSAMR